MKGLSPKGERSIERHKALFTAIAQENTGDCDYILQIDISLILGAHRGTVVTELISCDVGLKMCIYDCVVSELAFPNKPVNVNFTLFYICTPE